jgi:predicted nucleotidyltransferase component of viral defense system
MISSKFIKQLATQWQTTEINVTREYVQHLFLSNFYQQPDSGGMFFKGGTALRVLYHSPRFSEDLDFSAVKLHPSAIETAITGTLTEITRSGLKVDISEAKVTTGGYLAIIDVQLYSHQHKIQLEISSRKSNRIGGETILITSKLLPSYTVLALKQEILVEEKIAALLTRAKPRDFFDFYFILRAGLLSPQTRNQLISVKQLLEKKPQESFQELKTFLPASYRSIVKDFPTVLEREINRYL